MAACSACGATFTCGLRETEEPCWCASLPKLPTIDPSLDCLCPRCLEARLDAARTAGTEPAPAMAPDHSAP